MDGYNDEDFNDDNDTGDISRNPALRIPGASSSNNGSSRLPLPENEPAIVEYTPSRNPSSNSSSNTAAQSSTTELIDALLTTGLIHHQNSGSSSSDEDTNDD